ncbi:response regulator transcription factor [Flagellimonas zhangzhouensis]|uniref:Regulatory protein, luxR family n=1 Tax=Flagellimonas zhangzhouensis TaxID=1073328 RepID=A0A1H2U1J2_9FLAO|nr:response regulator transcription factor [Allomuricauda zhangzhouensis]SDQ21152.1 regulatory protein, luxR family [Allomuricauda zhangzhouensis]SDW50093.1 regulatory protein, luxR family [Allomuricauda zhangzhouensis]
MKKTVFVFSALIIALLLLFKLSRYAYLSGDLSIEIVIGVIAIVFFVVGIYINKKSLQKEKNHFIDHKKIEELGISKREYEVLVQISKGFSNKEIADTLFLSESTIKTHVSNLLVKLDSKRRTQAIEKAKNLQILPI